MKGSEDERGGVGEEVACIGTIVVAELDAAERGGDDKAAEERDAFIGAVRGSVLDEDIEAASWFSALQIAVVMLDSLTKTADDQHGKAEDDGKTTSQNVFSFLG